MAVIAEEPVRILRRILLQRSEVGSIGEKNVWTPIFVVIEDCDAASHRRRDVAKWSFVIFQTKRDRLKGEMEGAGGRWRSPKHEGTRNNNKPGGQAEKKTRCPPIAAAHSGPGRRRAGRLSRRGSRQFAVRSRPGRHGRIRWYAARPVVLNCEWRRQPLSLLVYRPDGCCAFCSLNKMSCGFHCKKRSIIS